MPSEQSHILALFAAGRIDIAQAERLLCLVSGRNRFLSLGVWAILLADVAWNHLAHPHLSQSLHAALESACRSEAFQTLQLFLNRFLGELP